MLNGICYEECHVCHDGPIGYTTDAWHPIGHPMVFRREHPTGENRECHHTLRDTVGRAIASRRISWGFQYGVLSNTMGRPMGYIMHYVGK